MTRLAKNETPKPKFHIFKIVPSMRSYVCQAEHSQFEKLGGVSILLKGMFRACQSKTQTKMPYLWSTGKVVEYKILQLFLRRQIQQSKTWWRA